MSMSDAACFKIAHVMLVKGQVEELLRCLPMALTQTFNKHPKMRAKQIEGEFAVAEIRPHLTLEDITKLSLLQVKEVNAEGMVAEHWHQYAQEQAGIPFDRYSQFPFCLHVWVDKANDRARLFLFSDHYLSDGSSGNTILNNVLMFASSLSLESDSATAASKLPLELPVRKSLYKLTMEARPYLSPILRLLMKFGARMLLKNTPMFVPLITPRSDQQDFCIPAPNNSSTMLFADGTKENLTKLIARCRGEDTTFFGAMTAATLVGYAAVTGASREKPLKMNIYANFNMRERVSVPIGSETVGSYVAASPMERLNSESVDITTKRFWDVARAAKQESTEMTQNFASLALPMVLFDQHYTSQSDPKFFEGIRAPYLNVADANISSVGRYPHKLTHPFRASQGSGEGLMAVESLHYNCRTPFLAPSSQFYVTSVVSVGYGFNHHYDEPTGKTLFEIVVAVMERSGGIGSGDTLADVIHQVVNPTQLENKQSASVAAIA